MDLKIKQYDLAFVIVGAKPKELSLFLKVTSKNLYCLYLSYLYISLLLTPIALAHWQAGEAHDEKRDGCIQIATHSFTPAVVDLLRDILLEEFNINATQEKKVKNNMLYGSPKREVGKVTLIGGNSSIGRAYRS
jgi:LAGLIDADG DNA endonuclease family